ncbi:MAG: hypothetical protein R3F43_14190 [bacterium]
MLSWETDNGVDFHIFDKAMNHAFYSREAGVGRRRTADITTGYGPRCFSIEDRSRRRTSSGHYYRKGAHGSRGRQGQDHRHDGRGGLGFEERPFVIMTGSAYVDWARSPTRPPRSPAPPPPSPVVRARTLTFRQGCLDNPADVHACSLSGRSWPAVVATRPRTARVWTPSSVGWPSSTRPSWPGAPHRAAKDEIALLEDRQEASQLQAGLPGRS